MASDNISEENVADLSHWYVVYTYSGYENKVKATLEKIVENRGIQDKIQEITEQTSSGSTTPKFSIKVVTELPTTNISSTTIYLLKTGEEDSNLYSEYIYVNNKWELLGTQKMDLSNYYTKEEVDKMLQWKEY